MPRWRTKLLGAVSCKPTRPHAILPVPPLARHIGHALLVPGLIGTAPIHGASSLSAILAHSADGDVDLAQAKLALRVLSAVGDGVGVPWLKGAAGIVLEIVNVLDTIQSNKADCRDLALRICQFLVVLHKNYQSERSMGDTQHLIEFQNALHRILRTVKSCSSSNHYRRFWKADDIKQRLVKCDKLLNHSRDIFLIAVQIDILGKSQDRISPVVVISEARVDPKCAPLWGFFFDPDKTREVKFPSTATSVIMTEYVTPL